MMNLELNEAIRTVRKLGAEYAVTKNKEIYSEYKKVAKEFPDHDYELMEEFFYSNEVFEAEQALKNEDTETNKVLIAVHEYLEDEELEVIKSKENIKYLPNRDLIIGTNQGIEDLIKEFPKLEDYEKDYGFWSLKSIIESEFHDGHLEIETGSDITIDTFEVMNHLIEDIKEIEYEIMNSKNPESSLNEWIDVIISEHFSQIMSEVIQKFKSLNTNYFFNDAYLR